MKGDDIRGHSGRDRTGHSEQDKTGKIKRLRIRFSRQERTGQYRIGQGRTG